MRTEHIYLIPQANLKHIAVLLHPLAGLFRVVLAQLDEVAEERDARDFRQVLDLGDVGLVEVFDEEEGGRDRGHSYRLGAHFEYE